MAVDEFLQTYKNTLLNKRIVNPLSSSNSSMGTPQLGIQKPNRAPTTVPGFGSAVPDWLSGRKSTAINSYINSKNQRTGDIAADYSRKAAGQVPVDEYGIVQDKLSNFNDAFQSQLRTTGDIGKNALLAEESKAQWQKLQNAQVAPVDYQFNSTPTINYTPGASKDNPGAQAVEMAMTAYRNKVPYVWAGNSLTQGVDCSGLVQQIYGKLGINVPRTTYDQAKSGKRVPLGNLLPGDLVFYNTGSQDPNGIGSLSHVAIYIGNGQIIDARNTRSGIKMGAINSPGSPAMAVRPW